MRLALCAGLEHDAVARAAGFDGVEPGASALLSDLERIKSGGVTSTNLFFGGLKSAYDDEALFWGGRVMAAGAEAGLDVMAVGSGGARRSPPGMDPADALGLFIQILQRLQEAHPDVPLAPELLNQSETDVGTDPFLTPLLLAESGLGYTVDLYHVLLEAMPSGFEPLTLAERAIPAPPMHLHLSSINRDCPNPDDPFLRALTDRCLDGGRLVGASYEGHWTPETLPDIAVACRRLIGG